jgi:hypothetical protein
MHLFIFSALYDAHAITVQAALKSVGIEVTRFTSDCFPVEAEISCFFDPGKTAIHIALPENGLNYAGASRVDVVWLRRPAFPNTAKLDLHPDDFDTVKSECLEFWQAFLAFSFPDANWVNPLNVSKNSRSKLLQLSIATRVGFNIPRTLVSNKPSDIRDFIAANEAAELSGSVAKSFYPVKWEEEKLVRMMYTAQVTSPQLPNDYLLHAIPTIYQARIPKAFEVRSTFFGRVGLHAKIVAEKNGGAVQDWRYGYYGEIKISPHVLPTEIEEKCFKLMDDLGLKFGCFDFIVTPEGKYIFLEVNEAGQFLWVEAQCPDIKMLAAFCSFIMREGNVPATTAPQFLDFSLAEVSAWPEVQATMQMEKLKYSER